MLEASVRESVESSVIPVRREAAVRDQAAPSGRPAGAFPLGMLSIS